MNAEQYLRKWNVDVGVAPNKTIPEGDRRRTAKVLRGKKRKRIILLFIRSFEVFWQCAIYAQVGAKCRLFFFSLGISRYYYVCFEFGTAIRQRQLNLTVSDFRPFAVIIYRPATVANEKKIVYFMECVCFSRCCCIQFLPCRFIRAPLLNLMPLVLWFYRHLTSQQPTVEFIC